MLRHSAAPTLRPHPNFNANQDAEALKKAMKGMGCDDKAIMNILCKRSNDQRQQIKHAYKSLYGEDLTKELIKELKGNFEDLIVALMYPLDEYDAVELHKAMKVGLGTNEAVLIEILSSRSNAEIHTMKDAYMRLYQRDLEKAVASETSSDFKHLLVSLVQGRRDETTNTDPAKAAARAKELYEAGEKKLGTDESVFNSIIATTNYAQLNLICQEYRKLAKHDLEDGIEKEFSGDVRDGLLSVVRCARNKAAYFANTLQKCVKGFGTDDKTLIRIIVSRCEKDMMTIKQEFQRQYANSLEAAISGDTSGKYKDALLLLIGGAN